MVVHSVSQRKERGKFLIRHFIWTRCVLMEKTIRNVRETEEQTSRTSIIDGGYLIWWSLNVGKLQSMIKICKISSHQEVVTTRSLMLTVLAGCGPTRKFWSQATQSPGFSTIHFYVCFTSGGLWKKLQYHLHFLESFFYQLMKLVFPCSLTINFIW